MDQAFKMLAHVMVTSPGSNPSGTFVVDGFDAAVQNYVKH